MLFLHSLIIVAVGVVCSAQQQQPSYPDSVPLPKLDPKLYAKYRLALDAIFSFTIRLQSFLHEDTHENFLVSPISAAVTLGQLMLGAEGQFLDHLAELLFLPHDKHYLNEKIYYKSNGTAFPLPYSTFHVQMSKLLRNLTNTANDNFVLKENSALFTNKNLTLDRRFKLYLRNLYLTQLHSLDFTKQPQESLRLINQWAKASTNGLIDTIVPHLSPSTSSIFAHAIYFLAEWETPFSNWLNRDGYFNVTSSKAVPVTYMVNLIEQILYTESKHYTLICLPYKNEELGMYIMLPTAEEKYRYDIKGFVQNLNASEVAETIAKAKRADVTVKLPKMTLSYTFSILEKLKKYVLFKKHGVNIAENVTNILDLLQTNVNRFDRFNVSTEQDIYLTKASTSPLLVSDIVQQIVVTVNEKGTEAAAVTSSTVDYILSKNFLVDRPFVFFIRHEATSATLFWGTIGNPVA